MKIKTFLACLVVITITGSACLAQETMKAKNEVRLGYGILTGVEMVNSLYSIWPAIGIKIMSDSISDYTCSFYGVADLEYSRLINRWLSVGVSLNVNPVSSVIKTKAGKEISWNYYVISVLPRVDFIYLNKGIFSMYSGIQAGAALVLWQDRQGSTTSYDSGISAAFHINAFGLRVGKEIGAFMEWGYGFRGVVNFGISGKF